MIHTLLFVWLESGGQFKRLPTGRDAILGAFIFPKLRRANCQNPQPRLIWSKTGSTNSMRNAERHRPRLVCSFLRIRSLTGRHLWMRPLVAGGIAPPSRAVSSAPSGSTRKAGRSVTCFAEDIPCGMMGAADIYKVCFPPVTNGCISGQDPHRVAGNRRTPTGSTRPALLPQSSPIFEQPLPPEASGRDVLPVGQGPQVFPVTRPGHLAEAVLLHDAEDLVQLHAVQELGGVGG